MVFSPPVPTTMCTWTMGFLLLLPRAGRGGVPRCQALESGNRTCDVPKPHLSERERKGKGRENFRFSTGIRNGDCFGSYVGGNNCRTPMSLTHFETPLTFPCHSPRHYARRRQCSSTTHQPPTLRQRRPRRDICEEQMIFSPVPRHPRAYPGPELQHERQR